MKRLWIKLMASLPLRGTTVLIMDGRTVVKRGRACAALLSELTELARSNGIEAACIRAAMKSEAGKSGNLSFFGIPRAMKQRFRNVWFVNWR